MAGEASPHETAARAARASDSTSGRRPVTTTLAPQRASSSAAPSPRPVPPPVMRMTWPASTPGANTSEAAPFADTAAMLGIRHASTGLTSLWAMLRKPLTIAACLFALDYLLWLWSSAESHDTPAVVAGVLLLLPA